MRVSENVRELQPSATIAMATRAKELRAAGRDIIDLSAGEPDFATPEFIARGGIGAIEQGFTKYTPVPGIPQLRQAIATEIGRESGRTIDPMGIVVSNGAKQALFNTCFVLFGPGDKVIIPAPYWTSYPDLVKLARAEPLFVLGDENNDFKVSVDHLEKAFDSNVRGIILNSPSNPTGAVYSRAEFEAIVRWAAQKGIWIVSDEIYRRLSYDGPATGVLDLDPSLFEHIVLIDGASKAFAMTGWRIGFSYTNNALAAKLAALQSHVTSNAATPSQYAALAAYKAEPPQDEAARAMFGLFKRRRDLLLQLLEKDLPGTRFVHPSGAFYLFLRTDEPGHLGSIEFCTRLLDEEGVALVPGEAFGQDQYSRMSFAASEQALTEGVRRIAQFMRKL